MSTTASDSKGSGTKVSLLSMVGPGIAVAATGVGAGDLATASFCGSELGTQVLWAVVVGAAIKFMLNEGLARWQLATGTSLIEGVRHCLGQTPITLFLVYLVTWSFFTAGAMMSACGAAMHALVPAFEDADRGKLWWGALQSIVGLVLVRFGGYRLFERLMGACIALMVVITAISAKNVWPGWNDVLRGLLVPRIPEAAGQGLGWTVALIGGIGGTVTILCYGYWIREQGRSGLNHLKICRADLAVGYLVTAFFGLAMIIVGSRLRVSGSGATLVLALADELEHALGASGRWVFLLGALSAVFSSLLGVWQAVPYLFADLWRLRRRSSEHTSRPDDLSRHASYRMYLLGLATVPMVTLRFKFRAVQKLYAIVGASFMPALALCLLTLNGQGRFIGDSAVNKKATQLTLSIVVVFFIALALKRFY